jgi:multicomponent Na+:H+ antiporter subunit C
MELPMAAAIAVLYAAGTYMILRPNLIRLAMGFGLYSNATNLLLITVGGYTRTSGAPFVGKSPQSAVGLMDPLPPDIILTAIVISFAVGALMLIVCYRVYQDHGTDDPQGLPTDDEDDPAEEPVRIPPLQAVHAAAGPSNHPPAGHQIPAVPPAGRPSAEGRQQ